VLDGIDAAAEAGLKIKINMVAMRGINEHEIEPMMDWAHGRGFGLTLIEGMPLGEVGIDRVDSYLPLKATARAPRQPLHVRGDRPSHGRAGALCVRVARPAGCSASSRR
jgi:molybdenum cofactor biosynthesis enzyme MoaA